MRLSLFTFLFFVFLLSQAQDGSNILYAEFSYLNQSHIGKLCHIDFGERSGPLVMMRGRSIDTIEINVSGKLVAFVEHRVDNGYNNWFGAQYLVSLPSRNNISKRIPYFRIDSLTSTKLYVSGHVSYYQNGKIFDTTTLIRRVFSEQEIARVLIKSKRPE